MAETTRAKASLWGGPFLFGLLLALLGLVALAAAGFTSLATVFTIGIVLVVAGLFEVFGAFGARRERSGSFLLLLLSGVLSVVVGMAFVFRPVAGLATLGLLLAAWFFATGLFRGVTSLMDRYPGWGWDLFYAVVAIALGLMIVAQWPLSAFWIVGTLVGVEIFMRGLSTMAVALQMRRGLRQLPA